VTDVVPGMNLQGFVKSHDTSSKFVVISLARHITAKANLRKMEADQIPDAFPVGKLVTGRILKSVKLSHSMFL